MARFSSVNEFSPAGTIIGAGASTPSNALKTEAGKSGQAFVHVTVLIGNLDVDVETSHDLTRWARIAGFNTITAIGDYVLPLNEEQLGIHTRLKYNKDGAGAATLGAVLQKKTGV